MFHEKGIASSRVTQYAPMFLGVIDVTRIDKGCRMKIENPIKEFKN